MNFSQIKILFLSANFFGYETAITNRLRELGADVDFFNERPSDSVFTKGMIRVKSRFYQKKVNRYYEKLWKQIKEKNYDYFLLIKGESVPQFFLKRFSDANLSAQKIFYSYDAVTEYPKFLKLYPFFDKNFTFEPADAKKYNLHFRPLFFLSDYKKHKQNFKPEYDLVFIGSAHTDRYLIGEKIRELCANINRRTFFYYYAPGKVAFVLKKIFDRNLMTFDLEKLSFKKLSHGEISGIYEQAFAVLDINKPFLNGLTMRTFEALAANKKLITTNRDIRNYPFYSEENIHILNRNDLKIEKQFFDTVFKEIDNEVMEKMSLDSWIHCLFFQDQDAYWGIRDKDFKV